MLSVTTASMWKDAAHVCTELASNLYVQYVAQYPDCTSIRTLKKKNSIFEAPFSVLGKRSISNES